MNKNVVIIGAGIAGANAATTLAGKNSVTLIGRESYPPYYRMRLEEVISGKDESTIFIHPESWYAEKGISLVYGEAAKIDRDGKKVHLADGREFDYDELIIATGSDAVSLPFAEGYTLRTIDDAKKIRAAILSSDAPISIIGGGLLGLELADTIKTAFDRPVTVFETSEFILPLQLDRDSAVYLKEAMAERGIKIVTGIKMVAERDGKLLASDGSEFEKGILIYSVGSRPAKAIAENSGVKCNRGILVGNNLSSCDGIYAVGDVSELDGKCFALAMYAREMGIFAAKSIDGDSSLYSPSEPSTILKVSGIDVASFGILDGEKTLVEKDGRRVTLVHSNGILKGVILINAKPMMMKARGAIGKPLDVSLFE